jgi:hypothetical protein
MRRPISFFRIYWCHDIVTLPPERIVHALKNPFMDSSGVCENRLAVAKGFGRRFLIQPVDWRDFPVNKSNSLLAALEA